MRLQQFISEGIKTAIPFDKKEIQLLDKTFKRKFNPKLISPIEYTIINKIDGDEVEVVISKEENKTPKKVRRYVKFTYFITDEYGRIYRGMSSEAYFDDDSTNALGLQIQSGLDALLKQGLAKKYWKKI